MTAHRPYDLSAGRTKYRSQSFVTAVREMDRQAKRTSKDLYENFPASAVSNEKPNQVFIRALGSILGVPYSTNLTTTRTNIVTALNALNLT